MKGCAMIIGVDRVPARLEMATSFGATHVIDTSNNKSDLTQAIKDLTGGNGSTITIDTSGNLGLITSGMDFTGLKGQMVLLGVPPMDASLAINPFSFMQVRGLVPQDKMGLKVGRQEKGYLVVSKETLLHLRQVNLIDSECPADGWVVYTENDTVVSRRKNSHRQDRQILSGKETEMFCRTYGLTNVAIGRGVSVGNV